MSHPPIATLTKPTTCPGVGGQIVATENMRDREGQYAGFVALVNRPERVESWGERTWSTHIVFFNDEHDDQWESCWGHYDQTEAEARADFAQRCLTYGSRGE